MYWVVRESSKQIGKIKYGFDSTQILDRSRLLNEVMTQRSLMEWV